MTRVTMWLTGIASRLISEFDISIMNRHDDAGFRPGYPLHEIAGISLLILALIFRIIGDDLFIDLH